MEKIIEKFIEKLSADFVIKKGGQALSIVVSSILPTVILFYLWDEHIYYDKELIRTIILILAVSLCTYAYDWVIVYIGEILIYGYNNPIISIDRKSTRLNSSHVSESRMPSSA